ncbi:hypothetical protein CORC01_05616 [Colletotrichum orchidophilum]|uniref:Integral membrane protein n=1 Tax=Colletotrichum orchidophilum TaxID=1209926 RepID=A0A1G4BCK7_9PEZI|nr:uncharacterized protein CORC01_05616 [Colletotrichum orchidophilum]OHE99123.1 hypothetical protein CORC01_05616 [Colletotrichum orchidophilum]
MDPNRQPYFPPPPGQPGIPPPFPPRPTDTATVGPYPVYSHGPFQPAHTAQSSQSVGNRSQHMYQPAYGAHPYHQGPSNSQNYSSGLTNRPGPTSHNLHSNISLPLNQPYSPPATYAHPSQGPAAAQSPSLSSALQQATSLFSDSQKVVQSCQDFKSKAKAKFTQYLSQTVTLSQSSYSPQAQYAQNYNHEFTTLPLSTTPVHTPGVQYHHSQPPQYQREDKKEAPATQPVQSTSYYPTPPQEQASPNISSPRPDAVTQQQDQHGQQAQQDPAAHDHVTKAQYVLEDNPFVALSSHATPHRDESSETAGLQQCASAVSPATCIPLVTSQKQPAGSQLHVYHGQEAAPRPLQVAQEPERRTALESHSSSSVKEIGINDSPTAQLSSRDSVASTPQSQVPTTVMDEISTQMGKVSVHEAPPLQSLHLGPGDEDYHEYKRAIPRVTDDGKPNTVAWECPEEREVEYETDWYHLPDIPSFLVCTHCLEMCLAHTPLESSFKRTREPRGRCRFNVPRITRLLLPECLERGNVTPLREFITARLDIQDCKGPSGADASAGIKWFKPLDDRLEGFISCEACYEDVVLATSFRHNFVPHDSPQPSDYIWACDICLPFINRSIVKFAKTGVDAWNDWVQVTAKHIALPDCDKGPVSSSSRRWMRLRGQRFPDFTICEKCFEQHVALTVLGKDFESIPHEPSVTGLDWMDVALGHRATEPVPYLCSTNSLPVAVSLTAAKDFQDINVLYQALETILSSPPCTEQGIVNGTWYTLAGGDYEGYDICSACHAAFITSFGLARFYQKCQSKDGGEAFLCSFERSAPRWLEHMNRHAEAVETGVWSRYSDFVRKFAGVPHCAKENLVGNRRWYGWDDCTICPECYVTFCAESSPGPGFTMEFNNDFVAEERMCCLYSPRMRQKWIEACQEGNADALVEFSRVRHGVWVQTVLQVRALRQMQDMQMMQAMHAGFMSVTYQGIESLKVVAGTTDGHEYGNSELGWHATQEGVTSAAYRNEMHAGMNQSNSAGTWMMIGQLLLQWQEFE